MGLFLVFELCENNCQERVDSIVSTLKERYSHTLSSASDLIEEREAPEPHEGEEGVKDEEDNKKQKEGFI